MNYHIDCANVLTPRCPVESPRILPLMSHFSRILPAPALLQRHTAAIRMYSSGWMLWDARRASTATHTQLSPVSINFHWRNRRKTVSVSLENNSPNMQYLNFTHPMILFYTIFSTLQRARQTIITITICNCSSSPPAITRYSRNNLLQTRISLSVSSLLLCIFSIDSGEKNLCTLQFANSALGVPIDLHTQNISYWHSLLLQKTHYICHLRSNKNVPYFWTRENYTTFIRKLKRFRMFNLAVQFAFIIYISTLSISLYNQNGTGKIQPLYIQESISKCRIICLF